MIDSKDAAVRKSNYSGVVVWLEATGGRKLPIQPKTAELVQKNKTFEPHVIAVPTGSTVFFPNRDPIFHNVFSNFDGMRFDVGLYAPGTEQKILFTHAGVDRVFCNIHPMMFSIIVVADTPYLAVTNADGSFQLGDVLAGEYRLRVFDERASPDTLKNLERNVTVGNAAVSLPAIEISEAGFIAAPHENKYNRGYPPFRGSNTDYQARIP